jgi:hypothetical protein
MTRSAPIRRTSRSKAGEQIGWFEGEAGSAQGMWFFTDAQVNQLTDRGETWNEGLSAGKDQSVGSTPAPR